MNGDEKTITFHCDKRVGNVIDILLEVSHLTLQLAVQLVEEELQYKPLKD